MCYLYIYCPFSLDDSVAEQRSDERKQHAYAKAWTAGEDERAECKRATRTALRFCGAHMHSEGRVAVAVYYCTKLAVQRSACCGEFATRYKPPIARIALAYPLVYTRYIHDATERSKMSMLYLTILGCRY